MPQKVYDRPGKSNDSDNESRPVGGADDGKGSLSPKESSDFDQIAAGIRDAEVSPSRTGGNESAASVKEKNLNYNPEAGNGDRRGLGQKTRGRFRSNRSKVIAFGAAASLSVAVAGTIVTAPAFIMNHISTLLLEKTNAFQTNQTLTFRNKKYASFTDRFSIDGRRGGAVIADMEKDGYKFSYDPADKKRITGISRAGVAVDKTKLDLEVSTYLDQRYGLFRPAFSRVTGWKTRKMTAFNARYKLPESSIVAKRVGGIDDDAAELRSRQYNILEGEERVSTEVNGPRSSPPDPDSFGGEDTPEYKNAVENYNRAASGSVDEDTVIGGIKTRLNAGDKVSNIPNAAALDGIESGKISAAAASMATVAASKGALATGLSVVKGIGVVTEPLEKVCSTRNALDTVFLAARVLNSIKLMRAAAGFITADDGQRRGEAGVALTAALMQQVALSDAALGNFASSSGYQKSVNGGFSKSVSNNTSGAFSVGRTQNGFWGGFRDELDIVNDDACSVIQNPGVQILQGVVVVGLTIFSFGSSATLTSTASGGTKLLIREGFKTVLKKAAFSAAIELSFEGVLALGGIYVQKAIELPFTGQETGGAFSNMLFSGAGVLHKQKNLNGGFVPATATDFGLAHDKYLAEQKEETKKTPFLTRIFDVNNSESLAYKSFTNIAFQTINPSDSVHQNAKNLASLPSSIAGSFMDPAERLFGSSAYAQEDIIQYDTMDINGTEYAIDPYGTFETIMPDWLLEYSDPEVEEENTEFLISAGHIDSNTLEPTSEQFAGHMDNCVYSTDTITPLEDYSGNDVTKDCAAQEDLTRRFKGHLVNLSDDDVVDAALFPENIDAQSAAQTGSSSGDAVSLSGDLIKGTPIDPVDTDELSCPVSPTITDAGIDSEAYNQGSQFSIRLCSVHNVRLNAIAAKQFDDLFTEAATAGFTIKGTGGFRTMAGQREGYNSAPDTFARPGYSNHQYGTAADISCQGGGADYTAGTGRGRDSFLAGVGQYPCLKWIAQNSPKFGLLIQCMAEGSDGRAIRAGSGGCEWWHLSPTGG